MSRREFFNFVLVASLFVFMSSIVFDIAAKASSGQVVDSHEQSLAKVGQRAPQFVLPDSKGKTVKLSDFQNKYVVLEWFNQGCPFVKKHYESGNMQKLQKEYTGKGVIWLSICSSAPGRQGYEKPNEYNSIFSEKHAAPTAILSDADGKVGRLYGAKTTPDMYIIDPKGILIYAGAIDDTPGVDQSEIAAAKNYVKAALDESMAGKAMTTPETKSYGCSVKY